MTGTDIVNIKNNIKHKTFEATGSGCPKPQYIQAAAASAATPMPDWITQKIMATGNGTDPEHHHSAGQAQSRPGG